MSSRGRRYVRHCLVAGLLSAAMLASSALPTWAEENQQPIEHRDVVYQDQLIGEQEASSEELQRLNSSKDEFIDSAMRRGSLTDTQEVEVLLDSEHDIVVAFNQGQAIDMLDVRRAEVDGEVVARAFGVATHEIADEGDDESPDIVNGSGFGFSGADPTFNGWVLTLPNGNRERCLVLTPNHDPDVRPDVGRNNHYVETCYWKYYLPENLQPAAFAGHTTNDWWSYARRGVAGGANGYTMDDLTIRSRPWGGTAARINGFETRIPSGADQTTCQQGPTLSASYGGFGISVPITNCQGTRGVWVPAAKEWGTDWDGRTNGRIGIESLGVVRTVESPAPSFADYIFASFIGCFVEGPLPHVSCYRDNVRWTDTGW